jgi:O-antigen ligase/polysaccharide polymerase Wzy-like membrane protein
MLVPVLATGFLGNWFLAGGVAILLLVYLVRPFDFIVAFLIVVAGSTFLNYQGDPGSLTKQMAILSIGIVWMLICYLLGNREEWVSIPITQFTAALGSYILWSLISAGRGVLAGHTMHALLLEAFPILAVGSAFLVANTFKSKRDLRGVIVTLIVIAYGSAAFGFYTFEKIRTHLTGVYFSIGPGLIAILLFNLALRARRLAYSLGWLALSLPLFLHQFLSFGRGMWLGNMAGMTVSILIFTLRRGAGGAWKRAGTLLGILVGTGILGAIAIALLYGQQDILIEAGARFATIGDTKPKLETLAIVARFVEYATVIPLILKQPWFGHGLGFEFFVATPATGKSTVQFWVHENYLLVWLKQGFVGLVLFVWMLWSAFWMSMRHSRRHDDPFESAWLATAAAGTVYLTVFAATDFPFDNVQPMFLLALLWGIAMALTQTGSWRIRWSTPLPSPGPAHD